jgi:prolyl-tRNA editing enzyme YbaK/EbsC (Cys-tRNA(Pro) deacylase)
MSSLSSSDALVSLESRVAHLEQERYLCSSSSSTEHYDVVDDSMRRARRAVEAAGLYSAVWRWVPKDYYQRPLPERAVCLQAHSLQHLCKCLLMENKKVTMSATYLNGSVDPTNPSFVLVVIQYAATLHVKGLMTALRTLRCNVQDRLDESAFDLRLASEEDNARLTGFTHNAVTPFGLSHPPSDLCMVLDASIVPLQSFWMGGGHVHLKLQVSVSDFISCFHPLVAPISHPRTGFNMDSADMDD